MPELPHYTRLEPKRFLAAYHDDLRRRPDGRSWPRWRNTLKAAHHYAEALLSLAEGTRKNVQRLAGSVDAPDDALEQFLRESPWDYEALQTHLAAQVPPTIRSPNAALLVDDFGIAKQGRHSVGVQRQYSGTLGKTGNCQVAVNLVYVAPGSKRNADQRTWPLGTQLYLPTSWSGDAARRSKAGVPSEVRFRTKHEIALDLLARARAHGAEHAFVGADAEYGSDAAFRATLRAWNEPYVVGVSPAHMLVVDAATPVLPPQGNRTHPSLPEGLRVDRVAGLFAPASWQRVEWSQGSQGTLGGLFHRQRVRVAGKQEHRWATDEVAWLLLEKRKDENGRDEHKAYLCWGMDDATIEDLVARAHLRWAIEQFHKEAKQLLGLDRFEGRTWQGWHHHVSMVLLAYAFVSQLRAKAKGPGPFPTLGTVARAVEWEMATQALVGEHGLRRNRARSYAATVLRRTSAWFKPRK